MSNSEACRHIAPHQPEIRSVWVEAAAILASRRGLPRRIDIATVPDGAEYVSADHTLISLESLVHPRRELCRAKSTWTSKPAIAGRSGWPLEVDMLGQVGSGERLTVAIVADVGDLSQAVQEAECLQDAGINAARSRS